MTTEIFSEEVTLSASTKHESGMPVLKRSQVNWNEASEQAKTEHDGPGLMDESGPVDMADAATDDAAERDQVSAQ